MGAWGTHPFSIVKSVRRGITYYIATWFPTSETARFTSKRDATAWIKARERGN